MFLGEEMRDSLSIYSASIIECLALMARSLRLVGKADTNKIKTNRKLKIANGAAMGGMGTYTR